jgi:disease resistance protein RPM1
MQLILLQYCRYLIVIDDVWDESTWKTIKCALVDNNCGSRVIVTTRNLHVARFAATPIGAVYELEPLSDAHSRSLFYKRIFGKEDGIHTELDEVAGRFLKKCGGIPLAIISIASLLASEPTTSWYDVYRRLSGPGLDKDKSMENMRAILSLSFSELPSHLKPCLLYLSFFPEDCKIDKDSLVSRWVAEGLIDEQCGDNLYELYDLGESYFVDLVNRSFIQPLDIDLDGIARACRVHDLILELLISMSTDDNFVLRSDRQKSIPQQCKIRRLSLQDGEKNIVKETEDLSHVRSVIAFGDAYKRMPPLSKFPLLRVLDLEGFPSYNNHPRDLRRLRHLRYLQLRGYLETEVLEEIGNLQYLKTLDLSNANIQDHELPASIAQLKNLQILLVGLNVRMQDGIGNLIQLQVVSWIKAAPNTVDELAKLTELKVLCIHALGNDESIDKAFLQSLSKLTKLLGILSINLGYAP